MPVEMIETNETSVFGTRISAEELKRLMDGFEAGRKEGRRIMWSPRPDRVIYSGPATVVLWDDGTKTVVKCAEGDVYDPAKAYLEAFFRKATGWSKSRCRRELGRITSDAGARDVRGL